jgi:hypothetical protein
MSFRTLSACSVLPMMASECNGGSRTVKPDTLDRSFRWNVAPNVPLPSFLPTHHTLPSLNGRSDLLGRHQKVTPGGANQAVMLEVEGLSDAVWWPALPGALIGFSWIPESGPLYPSPPTFGSCLHWSLAVPAWALEGPGPLRGM